MNCEHCGQAVDPKIPPRPTLPDKLRAHRAQNPNPTGQLTPDRAAMRLAMMAHHLKRIFDGKGYDVHVDPRDYGFSLHVDMTPPELPPLDDVDVTIPDRP